MEKALFEKYVNLIRKRAHEYSKLTGVDYSELESQGFLIYCECLEKYDVTKSSFCTYLYIQLTKLGDYVKTYQRQQGVLIQDYYTNENDYNIENDYEKMLPAREISPAVADFLKQAKELLSQNAYSLMEWIIGRTWEGKNKRKPTISMAVNYFKLPKHIIEELWEECKTFWNCEGFKIYA